jgi:hypothetical protein
VGQQTEWIELDACSVAAGHCGQETWRESRVATGPFLSAKRSEKIMSSKGVLLLSAALCFGVAAWAAPPAVAVFPVGPPSGGDDTAAVATALSGCVNASTPCTVVFGSGVYQTKQQFVRNFRGTVMGQGMRATVIEPYLGDGLLPVTPFADSIFGQPLVDSNQYPTLMMFVDGDLTMQDLGFRATASELTQDWNNNDPYTNPVHYLSNFVRVTGTETNVVIQRASFEGGLGRVYAGLGGRSFNVDWAVAYVGWNGTPLKGSFKLLNSEFKTVNMASEVDTISESSILISGNMSEDARVSYFVLDTSKSKVNIVGNRINSSSSSWVDQILISTWGDSSEFLIDKNSISTGGEVVIAIYVGDYAAPEQKSRIQVTGNTVSLTPVDYGMGGAYNAHIVLDSAQGVVTANNRLLGSGEIGIFHYMTNDCLTKANNLNGWSPSAADLAIPGIWLGPIYLYYSTNTTVIGGNLKENVIDDGGTGNIIVGYNSQRGNSAGQKIGNFMKNKLRPTPGWVHKP